MNVFRQILHVKTGTSDKVYIVEVNKVESKYVVLTTWGKRSAPRLSSQIKEEHYNERMAVEAAERLIKAKKRSKDQYRVAASNLKISGFKVTDVNIATVIEASKKPSGTVIAESSTTSLRKLRL